MLKSEDGSLNKKTLHRLVLFKVNSCTFWFGHTALLTVLSNYGAESVQRVCRQVWRGLSISLSSLASESSHVRTSKTLEELKGPLAQLSAPHPPFFMRDYSKAAPRSRGIVLSPTCARLRVEFPSIRKKKKHLVNLTQQPVSILFQSKSRPKQNCIEGDKNSCFACCDWMWCWHTRRCAGASPSAAELIEAIGNGTELDSGRSHQSD